MGAEAVCIHWVEALPENEKVRSCAASNHARLVASEAVPTAFEMIRQHRLLAAAIRLEGVDCDVAHDVSDSKTIAETFIEAAQDKNLPPQMALRLIKLGRCMLRGRDPHAAGEPGPD